ncbi:MAG: hypothetical protein WA140_07410 [Geobacteraceae bacterium]
MSYIFMDIPQKVHARRLLNHHSDGQAICHRVFFCLPADGGLVQVGPAVRRMIGGQ